MEGVKGLQLVLDRLSYMPLLPMEGGLTRPMILPCHDGEHLERVQSPLLEYLDEALLDRESVRYVHREYIPAVRWRVPDSPLAKSRAMTLER